MSAALFCFWGSCRRPLWIVIRLLLPVGNSVPARLVCRQAGLLISRAEVGPANQRCPFAMLRINARAAEARDGLYRYIEA